MRVPEHPTQIRQMVNGRLKQLVPKGPLLAASLALVQKRCGQPSCHCAGDGPLHTAHHLTLKVNGKTRTVYVPKALVPEVRTWLAEHQRLKTLLHEIHQLSMALLRARARLLRLKAGRP